MFPWALIAFREAVSYQLSATHAIEPLTDDGIRLITAR